MKKIVTFLLSVVLIIGTACMFGCGDATFNGNYKEVSASSAEVQQFSADTESASRSENFDITKGAEMELKLNGTAEGVDVDLEANFKIASVGDDTYLALQSEGAVKGTISGTFEKIEGNADIDVKFYYTDGYGYLNGKFTMEISGVSNETTLKNKIPLELEKGIDSIINDVSNTLPDIRDLAELADGNLFVTLVAMSENLNGVKLYLDADARKVKVEFSSIKIDEIKCDGELYLVYDEQYHMSAFKVDVKITTAAGEEMTVYFMFKNYSGTVKVPSEKDREEYADFAGISGLNILA